MPRRIGRERLDVSPEDLRMVQRRFPALDFLANAGVSPGTWWRLVRGKVRIERIPARAAGTRLGRPERRQR
ncbi:MAG: hypothetical protein ABID40_00015 [Candidatus Bipolaricaulota bacterium]